MNDGHMNTAAIFSSTIDRQNPFFLHAQQKLGARKSWNDVITDSSRGNSRKGIEREQAFLQLGQVDSYYVYHLNSLPCYLFPVEHLKVTFWASSRVIRKLDFLTVIRKLDDNF